MMLGLGIRIPIEALLDPIRREPQPREVQCVAALDEPALLVPAMEAIRDAAAGLVER